jgi:hypothetical protein
MSGGGDSLPPLRVAYTYGGNGWIQRYLLEVDGSHYVAPFQYVLPGYRKRVDSLGAFYFLDMARWLTVDFTTNGEAKFFDINSNSFRATTWDRSCSPCHVTGTSIQTVVNGTDTSYRSMWVGRGTDSAKQDQNALVGCESCHGPGSAHVADPFKPASIINPASWSHDRAGTDLRLDLCGNCHYRAKSTGGTFNYPFDEANQQHYIPGRPIRDYVKDMFTGMNTWPDRFTSYAHHQTGQDFLRSKMYEEHAMKNGCSDCHSVHHSKPGLPYQLKSNYYSLETGQGCISCHETKNQTVEIDGRRVNAHSRHPQSMSQCVNCHMTKTASIGFLDIPGNQYWEFSKRLYEFSSHSFRVIRPSATREYASAGINIGMMNTCSESCHRNGRGSRNSNDSIPEAPTWGIWDNMYGVWNERSDLQLADTLWYFYQRMYPGIADVKSGTISLSTSLNSVSPNPFTSTTEISYSLAREEELTLEVYDARGRSVRTLVDGRREAGHYRTSWDGTDHLGARLPAGVYFIRMKSSLGSSEQRVILSR